MIKKESKEEEKEEGGRYYLKKKTGEVKGSVFGNDIVCHILLVCTS